MSESHVTTLQTLASIMKFCHYTGRIEFSWPISNFTFVFPGPRKPKKKDETLNNSLPVHNQFMLVFPDSSASLILLGAYQLAVSFNAMPHPKVSPFYYLATKFLITYISVTVFASVCRQQLNLSFHDIQHRSHGVESESVNSLDDAHLGF